MNTNRLLLVEDDADLRTILESELAIMYQVTVASTGTEAVQILDVFEPEIVLLDLGLPGIHGLSVLEIIQSKYPRCRICVMTTFTELETKLAAFAAGGDDYIVKPFAMAELSARINALLKRGKEIKKSTLLFGDFCIYRGAPVVQIGNIQVQLTPLEHRLLICLASEPGQVFSRSTLLDEVWDGADRYPNTVDVHIESLRKKIDIPFGTKRIRTAYRQGYFFEG